MQRQAQLLAPQGYGGYLPQKIAVREVYCKHVRNQALKEHNKDNMIHADLYIKCG